MTRSLVLALPALLAATAAVADEAAETYVEDALPYAYHTCESVVLEADGDEAYTDAAIRALVALSLYNREIDVTRVALSDAQKDALQTKFVATLAEGCAADNDALLAGVIDHAVAAAISSEAPDAYVR